VGEKVFLFDIDLTMIRTNGAGSAAMTATMLELAGVESAFAGMVFAGRTDRALLREALTRCERLDHDFDGFCAAFEERYLTHLARELEVRGGRVLAGVRETIAATASLPGARLGLATGNFRRAAEIKLGRFDLWQHFPAGGFAEDGEDRAHVVAAAIARTAGGSAPEAVFVLGDSAHDIEAARANGAYAIGVCTGDSDEATLRAAGADLVLADLSEPAVMLRALGS
jgi:phosphoglycolate phosphatase-like HAD superfamily hydrolase